MSVIITLPHLSQLYLESMYFISSFCIPDPTLMRSLSLSALIFLIKFPFLMQSIQSLNISFMKYEKLLLSHLPYLYCNRHKL